MSRARDREQRRQEEFRSTERRLQAYESINRHREAEIQRDLHLHGASASPGELRHLHRYHEEAATARMQGHEDTAARYQDQYRQLLETIRLSQETQRNPQQLSVWGPDVQERSGYGFQDITFGMTPEHDRTPPTLPFQGCTIRVDSGCSDTIIYCARQTIPYVRRGLVGWGDFQIAESVIERREIPLTVVSFNPDAMEGAPLQWHIQGLIERVHQETTVNTGFEIIVSPRTFARLERELSAVAGWRDTLGMRAAVEAVKKLDYVPSKEMLMFEDQMDAALMSLTG